MTVPLVIMTTHLVTMTHASFFSKTARRVAIKKNRSGKMSKAVCWSSRAMPVLPDELKGKLASRCAAAAGRLPTLAAMHSARFNHHFLSQQTGN